MIGPNLSEWAIGNRSLVVFLMILSVIVGAIAFGRLGRAEDPAFTVRTMVVSAAWPGATVDETLSQVTERIERTLQETRRLDRVRSYTTAGATTIFVDLEGVTPRNEIADIWYQVRKNVGDMRGTLPSGVIGPAFNDDFGDTYGIIFGFTADGFSQRELRDYVEDARSRFLAVKDVSKIDVLGAQDEVIFIEFSTERLAALGLDYNALVAALQAQNVVRPSGVVQTRDERVFLRVTGAFDNEEDIRSVNFVVGGRNLRLGDISNVRRGYSDPPQPAFRVNGKPAIGLAIAMRDGGDILALGDNIRRELAAIRAGLPIGIEPVLVTDQASTVKVAIGDFIDSLWQAILIILAASFVSLGLRPGAVVALSIPLTLAIVFGVMNAVGLDLQRISLGALIIALTLLVDDAMTTVDAMMRRLAAGDAKEAAATFAYKTLAAPMLAGTLITIAGFVPIGFAKSSASEYTFSIFAVVAISLIVSWFVAVIFAPLIGIVALKAPKSAGLEQDPGRVARAFTGLLSAALRGKWIVIFATFGLFLLAIVLSRFVPSQFFPSSDRPELVVDVTLRQNASTYATDAVTRKIDQALAGDADVERWSTYVGRGAVRFYLPLNVQLPNPFFGQVVIVTKGVDARNRVQQRMESLLSEKLPEVVGRVSPLELGPPVGWPLQWRVSGPDKDEVAKIAQNVARLIATNSDVRHVHFDWMEPARQLRIRVDQEQAGRLGVSSAMLASTLNAAVTGTSVTQVRDDIYLVNVVARATENERSAFSTLRAIQVPIAGGRTVPLTQFATFEYEQEYPLVWRRNRVPTLTVRADVAPGVLPANVVTELEPRIEDLDGKLAKPYRIALGGIAEESAASSAAVFGVVPLMLTLMIVVLMVALGSFTRVALVLTLLPLGLIGVVLALLVGGRPLGFVAILGILALLGMIAKNAVILISQIEADRDRGLPVREAVLEASASRFRPLMLTAISTVLGLIPIAPTVFWGPMAFAIMGGLLVATLLTLVFLPAVYLALFGRRTARVSDVATQT